MTNEGLDLSCGSHFTFRTLVEAGETWHRLRVPNLPSQPETWTAIRQLTTTILDPVVEQFGSLKLTYGFASPALARRISHNIDPSRDQHAGHELHPDGRPVCSRLGQAVDFFVEGACSAQIAAWVAAYLPFDRLYFYGSDKPIHVSVGPQNSRAIVEMSRGPSGRRIPQRRTLPWLISRHGAS